ncbi:glycosyltransferase family 2 protein [Flavobacterium aciduliphilum]|uniref:Glycosyltransferase involved in cell wall biosynthesis n=1 Tax=Flavobacterium aciduliphilum TaxID=1101402 RepID=A0A328Y7I0_9FLAO|nr:glycosyltransferase family 2 protein [Flavobacterium aciduliphilum]RAR69988.1 glycosyltransferase involved in cell wall biosynthesis [Flavobacterium aciduliphilum]
MQTITVIIPTYNEENYIEDCLHAVSFAHQIIIIDSFSADNTLTLAKKFDCQIIQRAFDNFSNQKNEAIKQATGDWILFVDADERVTEKLKHEIFETLKNPKYDAYKLRFPHFYMNRFLYHTENKVVRLVKNDSVYFEGDVHEKLIHKGEAGILKNFMIHYTYKGLFHYIKKKDSYAWFQAKMSKEKNKSARYFHLVFKPFYRFFHTYIIRKGFLDGVPGLAVATIDAYGVFSRYVKMILLDKNLK